MYAQYISTFNTEDLKVRKINNYSKNIPFVNLTTTQNTTFKTDFEEFELKLKSFPRFSDIIAVTVKFFKDSLLENGFPHTVKDYIMLPIDYYFSLSKIDRIKLLVHEYIHIYQRMYPFEFNHFLIHTLGLQVHNFVSSSEYQDRKRSNPDINNVIYRMIHNKYNIMLYKSNPKTLRDSYIHTGTDMNNNIVINDSNAYSDLIKHYQGRVNIQNEHPYESLATVLAYVIITNDVSFKILKDYLFVSNI